MADIKNAAPMVIDLGTQDLSTKNIPISSLISPQHLPKFYIFAEDGPIGPTFVDLDVNSITQMYGDDTFNVDKKYYTHQTPFLQAAVAGGNSCVVHRLIPPDAKDVANIALYLDVLPTQVALYEKNADGSTKLDNAGLPVTQKDTNGDDVTVAGFKVCWVADHVVASLGQYDTGLLTMRNGLQVEGATQSMQYPIYEFSTRYQGERGLKLAVQLYAALQSDQYPFPTGFLNDAKVYPFYFRLVELTDAATGKTKPILNGYGSQFSRFSTQKNAQDPTSGLIVDIAKTIKDQYIDSTYSGVTGLGGVTLYENNINMLVTQFYNAEKNISDPYRDSVINNTEENYHALNSISFTSSNGSPYQTIKMIDTTGSIRLTKNTSIFLKGAYDGTMSESLLDTMVALDMDNYDDPTSEYNDIVLHPASIIYDSGFTLSTKKAMAKFIARRKDTIVVLSTFSHSNAASLLADQYSIGVALKTMLELYPESSFFGTPVMRGMIFGSSGRIVNSPYQKRVSLAYALVMKASRYMGAKSGAWKNGFCFDKAPLSIINEMYDIDTTWVPAITRNAMWAVGINFALNYKVKTQFFPALQTVYENDTSVLNSFFVVLAISYLNKIEHAAWREFSGTISFTNAQLEEKVNTYVAELTKDKFDGKFIIIPDCKVTEADALRGYSWTLNIKIGAENSKTVMTTSVSAYRSADLLAQP